MRKYDLVVLSGWTYDIQYLRRSQRWEVIPGKLKRSSFYKQLEDLPSPLKEAVLYALATQCNRQDGYALTLPLKEVTIDIWNDGDYTIKIEKTDKYPDPEYYPTIDEYKSLIHNQKGNKWQNQGKRGRTRG